MTIPDLKWEVRKARRLAQDLMFDKDLETWDTLDLVRVLTERYEPSVIPPCRICGGPLTPQKIGGGEPTEWACSPNEEDPDHPGYIRTKEGRGVDKHYSQSRFVDLRQGGDEVVMEAVRRLKKAEAIADEAMRAVEMDPRILPRPGHENEGEIEVWTDGHAHTFSPTSTLDAARERIAELEDAIDLEDASADVDRSYGRNKEACIIVDEILARRGLEWGPPPVTTRQKARSVR